MVTLLRGLQLRVGSGTDRGLLGVGVHVSAWLFGPNAIDNEKQHVWRDLGSRRQTNGASSLFCDDPI